MPSAGAEGKLSSLRRPGSSDHQVIFFTVVGGRANLWRHPALCWSGAGCCQEARRETGSSSFLLALSEDEESSQPQTVLSSPLRAVVPLVHQEHRCSFQLWNEFIPPSSLLLLQPAWRNILIGKHRVLYICCKHRYGRGLCTQRCIQTGLLPVPRFSKS